MKPTNKLIKRLSLYLFLVFFTLQTPSWTDDIRDFQIEGMSIGDSLLEYLSEKEIKRKIVKQDYKDEDFKAVFLESPHKLVKFYDALYVNFKKDDTNFVIYGLAGIKDYEKISIKKCLDKKNEVVGELKLIFPNSEVSEDEEPHPGDSSGKSIVYRTSFGIGKSRWLPIEVSCFDWAKKAGFRDHLRVNIKSDEYNDWLEKQYN